MKTEAVALRAGVQGMVQQAAGAMGEAGDDPAAGAGHAIKAPTKNQNAYG